MRIAVISNTTWYLYNFRLSHMLAYQQAGHEVIAIGPDEPHYISKIEAAGIPHHVFNVSGDGINPVRELQSLWSLVKTLKRLRIQVILSNTPKGNIYAAVAARLLGIAIIPNVSGLGHVFIHPSWLTHLVKLFYRIAFAYPQHVMFQNRDDHDFFIQQRLIRPQQAKLIPGSGIDLLRFIPPASTTEQGSKETSDKSLTFLLPARLLWDKGVGEFVEAARHIRQRYPQMRFQLLGSTDIANPAAIPQATVKQWHQEGVVEYLGKTDNVIPFIQQADCVVLPSYREGTPRSLLEASSMGKPIITTNTVGCRNVVEEGITGYLCRLQDANDLAQKMLQLLSLGTEQRLQMGLAGRRKMEREFDEKIVIDTYLQTIRDKTYRLRKRDFIMNGLKKLTFYTK
ncbi:MAG: glycosyltransferase family 4 protein [Candidatus Thiothrix putei]|uniref:Glycosyltransferase family 4 protein n=1 Tax=Candidatus Thiothrix putei TaxID=3080811 RepID=A0AA95HJV4_9GAMM|nr:MAG: glycosyltransferase family 4 protein [Candidatus Thiothrix putei]